MRIGLARRVYYLVLVGILLLLPASCANKKQDPLLGDIRLETLEGEPVDLESMKDKIIFLNFWATWCKPCLQEMPSIQFAMKELEGEDIVFLFASNEETDQIRMFAKSHKFPFQYVRVLNQEALGIQALPTTFIFDESGNLTFSEPGFRNWSDESNLNLIKLNNP